MSSHMQPYGKQNHPNQSQNTTIIIERNLNLPTSRSARHPNPREVTLQILAHTKKEMNTWKSLNPNSQENLLHHLEQALAHHVVTDRHSESTYQFDVNDLMFITKLITTTNHKFVFTSNDSQENNSKANDTKAEVHHWTLKHSWWWANQPHIKQQEMEACLEEFNEALQTALKGNLHHRVQSVAAEVDGIVYAVPTGVATDRFAQVAFGICNLAKGGYSFNFDVLYNHLEKGTRTVAEYIVGPRSWCGKDGLIWLFPFRNNYVEIEVDSHVTKRTLQNPDTSVQLVEEVSNFLAEWFIPERMAQPDYQDPRFSITEGPLIHECQDKIVDGEEYQFGSVTGLLGASLEAWLFDNGIENLRPVRGDDFDLE